MSWYLRIPDIKSSLTEKGVEYYFQLEGLPSFSGFSNSEEANWSPYSVQLRESDIGQLPSIMKRLGRKGEPPAIWAKLSIIEAVHSEGSWRPRLVHTLTNARLASISNLFLTFVYTDFSTEGFEDGKSTGIYRSTK